MSLLLGVLVLGATATTVPPPGDPIAIAVVYNTAEWFVGNETIEPEDSPARYRGLLPALSTSLDGTLLARRFPVGSQLALISYDATVTLRQPLAPLRELTPSDVGTQHDFYNHLGMNLTAGIDAGITTLEASPLHRRVLIVISDGTDTYGESRRFDELRIRAAQRGIETFAIVYKSALSPPENHITRMIPDVRTLPSSDLLAPALASIAISLYEAPDVSYRPAPIIKSWGEPMLWMNWWLQLALGAAGSGLILLALYVRDRSLRAL
jgi:hypothetical protein